MPRDPTRYRYAAVLLLSLAAAATVRFWAWDGVGLDHFDEGGYAMSARSVAEGAFADGRYPRQHFLSPPFLFGTAGMAMRVLGTSDSVLVGLSATLGIGTVLLVFLMASSWFGRPAAVGASVLIAFADFHVLYSRSGLTDVAFGFWFLCALWCFAEAERRESWSWAVLAGLATGCAWNTKYHGWLAVVVATAALLLTTFRSDRRRLVPGLARIAVAGAVAAALYAPWAWFVMQQPGGYARLTQEHSAYLRPFRVIQQTWTHLNTQLYLDGWLGRLAPGIAALVIAWVAATGRRALRYGRAGLVGLSGIALGSSVFIGVAALASVPRALLSRSSAQHVALAFFAGFTALTPLYYPFPRLVLPWVLSACLLAGPSIAAFVSGEPVLPADLEQRWKRPLRWAFSGLALGLVVAVAWIRPPWEAASTYRPKDGFRAAATDIAGMIPTGSTVLVWGEPGVVFYLRDDYDRVFHVDGVRRLSSFAEAGRPVYLVTGIYAMRTGGDFGLEGFRFANPGILQEVASVPVRDISDVRLLDEWSPGDAHRFLDREVDAYDLHLFRVASP